jgi:hydroxymethylpyrimidine/phosphomethylpyrimidine kinase
MHHRFLKWATLLDQHGPFPLPLSMLPKNKANLPIVLSIAGYDPSSGAGITADIKTIAAHACYGVTCITALTVQSTQGVKRVEPVEGRLVTDTLQELISDFSIAAVKIGMLGSVEVGRAVAAFLRRYPMRNVVLDPILKSSSGTDLLSKEGIEILRNRFLPLADVITPNIDEASALTGLTISQAEDMEAVAIRLHEMGAKNVVITGGHLDPPVDLLSSEAGRNRKTFVHAKVMTRSTHGTGCAFSTALACNLAHGKKLTEATGEAKQYVTSALKNAFAIGNGKGPVNHFWKENRS